MKKKTPAIKKNGLAIIPFLATDLLNILEPELVDERGRRNISRILGRNIFFSGRQDYKIDCLAAEFKDWEVSV